jgi:o-succinylbenzoate synthase
VKRTLLRLAIPFREPFTTAAGTLRARELLLLRLEDEDGATGVGEAAPLESYDGVTIAHCAAHLRPGPPGPDAPPQARACEEMANADLEGRRAGRPAAGPGSGGVAVNMTLGAGPPETVAERAAAGAAAGHRCFKLKVGLDDDRARLAAVREAVGPDAVIRLDANGAWDATAAVRAIRELAELGLELVEQPCRTLGEMSEVRDSVAVPIAADESIATAADVRAAADEAACDLVCIKLGASGGIEGARAALRVAEQVGLGAYVTSTLDGPWGIAAALRVAASERVTAPCGLATLTLFDAAIAAALPEPRDGVLDVPSGPGLGVEVDGAALAEVLVEELG